MENLIGFYTLTRREVERTFRVAIQTIFSPLISAALFIFVFGHVVGGRIDTISDIPYIVFVFPGILVMNVLSSAFNHSSSSVYFGRFTKSIEEILVAPLSYIEIILGFIAGAVIRGLIVGAAIVLMGILFGAVYMHNPFLFVLYIIGVSILFGLLGILTGLVAKNFEQLAILSTFIIMPLSFLGGMFYSLDMLPEAMQTATLFNPFFYLVDGMRYSMTGIHDANLLVGGAIIAGLIAALGALVWYLFRIGWRIRE